MVVRLRCYRHATTKHNVDPLHTPPSERDAIIKSAQHEHGSWFSLKLTSTIPTDIRHLSSISPTETGNGGKAEMAIILRSNSGFTSS